jgi:hypothetical protein
MINKYFPNISEDQILLINRVFRSIEENPDFLDDPKCQYTDVVKSFFTSRGGVAKPAEDLFEGDAVESVERQIQKLINDLEEYGKALNKEDASERLQYLKTKAGLVEKLITYQERVTNLKHINEFRSVVIQFMDEVLDKDQITNFMQRIDGVLSNGK